MFIDGLNEIILTLIHRGTSPDQNIGVLTIKIEESVIFIEQGGIA